jgi:uncharacterized membrane protein
MKELNDLLTAVAAAQKLNVSVRTLANWRTRGWPKIEYVKIGRCVRYRRSALETYIIDNIANGAR